VTDGCRQSNDCAWAVSSTMVEMAKIRFRSDIKKEDDSACRW
jgi:hypothetical protein